MVLCRGYTGQAPSSNPGGCHPFRVLLPLFAVDAPLAMNYDEQNGNVVKLRARNAKRFEAAQFMVPHVWTSNGHSRRLQTNFQRWCYQVTEFDSGTLDQQAAKILWLAQRSSLPLAMVLWSGGKSLHAWWDSRSASDGGRAAVSDLAISIGADPAHKTINQLVRVPNAIRKEKQKRQSVIYL